jgi:hypothetical protein
MLLLLLLLLIATLETLMAFRVYRTVYSQVVTLCNLRFAFRLLSLMHTECIHGLLFFS